MTWRATSRVVSSIAPEDGIDPTEIRVVDDLIATFPPTSEVGRHVRDVLAAARRVTALAADGRNRMVEIVHTYQTEDPS